MDLVNLHRYQKTNDGLLTISDIYGISDSCITSIEEVKNKSPFTDWDNITEGKESIRLRKQFDKGGVVVDYLIGVYRPWRSSPARIEAMGATDQGQYLEIHYSVREKRKNDKNVLPVISSTSDIASTIEAKQENVASIQPLPTADSLKKMLSDISRIRVIDAGMSGKKPINVDGRSSEKVKALLDTSSKEEIDSFRSYFTIIEDQKRFGYCMCLGWPTFEFFSGEKLVTKITLHHGGSIRWHEWRYDAALSQNAGLLNWLDKNGVSKPKATYETDIARAEKSRITYQQWLSKAPKLIRLEVGDLLKRKVTFYSSQDAIGKMYESFLLSSSPESLA